MKTLLINENLKGKKLTVSVYMLH